MSAKSCLKQRLQIQTIATRRHNKDRVHQTALYKIDVGSSLVIVDSIAYLREREREREFITNPPKLKIMRNPTNAMVLQRKEEDSK